MNLAVDQAKVDDKDRTHLTIAPRRCCRRGNISRNGLGCCRWTAIRRRDGSSSRCVRRPSKARTRAKMEHSLLHGLDLLGQITALGGAFFCAGGACSGGAEICGRRRRQGVAAGDAGGHDALNDPGDAGRGAGNGGWPIGGRGGDANRDHFRGRAAGFNRQICLSHARRTAY